MGRRQLDQTGRRRRLGVWIVAGAVMLTACGGDDDNGAASEPALSNAPSDDSADIDFAASEEAPGEIAIGGDRPADDESADTGGGNDVAIDLGAVGRDVIIEMHVTMSSDDIQRSVAAVSARAAALGGGIASSQLDYGNRTVDESARGYAVLVVKVPPGAVDDLLSGLERTGTIQSIDQSAQDVTEQLVDLDVRISNARTSVERVRGFMDRTDNLSELVTLEAELSRRQTELERLEAQQRNLSDRVALSTVTVEIIPTALVPEPPDDDDSIGDALRTGWDGFVGTLFAIVYVLAVLLPFLVLAGVVAGVALWMQRRRGRSGSSGPGLAAPPVAATPVAEPPVAESEPGVDSDSDGHAAPHDGPVSVGDGDASRPE